MNVPLNSPQVHTFAFLHLIFHSFWHSVDKEGLEKENSQVDLIK
jgi:hypothetical protein